MRVVNKKYIIFELYEDVCAISVEEIHEILELDSMIKTSSNELNLTTWNNVTLPVIDPVSMMALSEHYPSVTSRIIVIENRSLKFGVLVDRILGVMELNEKEFFEPSITEPRYVMARTDDFKIFTPDVFLTDKMITKFRQAYQIDLSGMEDVETVFGERLAGKAQVVEKIRLRSLNWLISATRKNIDEKFIDEAMEIHNLMTEL